MEGDSIAIAQIKIDSDEQVLRKGKLYNYFEGASYNNDSISHFFDMQWGMPLGFNPTTTTLDEMKSSGRISVIQNPDIRKQIIKTYNNYQVFTNGTQAYYERQRGEVRKLAFKIPRVFDVQSLKNAVTPDIITALKNDELKNAILTNYALTVNRDLTVLQEENHKLLARLREYISQF